jgi:hypothetical protein
MGKLFSFTPLKFKYKSISTILSTLWEAQVESPVIQGVSIISLAVTLLSPLLSLKLQKTAKLMLKYIKDCTPKRWFFQISGMRAKNTI